MISDPEANPIQHLIRAGTIYIGLLGQGIICLVDQVQAPGHYREGWHGRNGQEQAVAGVRLCVLPDVEYRVYRYKANNPFETTTGGFPCNPTSS
ncbi:MAG: hypothetical protein QF879_04765 [Candidatus Latescibacteria bacterium]|nr:hypothetical protein [Candidatus Latescibacterota bacterium]